MLLNIDRDRNIDFFGKKMSIFCRTHIAVRHRIQGGRPGPLRLPSAAGCNSGFGINGEGVVIGVAGFSMTVVTVVVIVVTAYSQCRDPDLTVVVLALTGVSVFLLRR